MRRASQTDTYTSGPATTHRGVPSHRFAPVATLLLRRSWGKIFLCVNPRQMHTVPADPTLRGMAVLEPLPADTAEPSFVSAPTPPSVPGGSHLLVLTHCHPSCGAPAPVVAAETVLTKRGRPRNPRPPCRSAVALARAAFGGLSLSPPSHSLLRLLFSDGLCSQQELEPPEPSRSSNHLSLNLNLNRPTAGAAGVRERPLKPRRGGARPASGLHAPAQPSR